MSPRPPLGRAARPGRRRDVDSARAGAPPAMSGDPQGRNFVSAPRSVKSLVAALLEPAVAALVLLGATLWYGQPLDRPTMVLMLLVLALALPGVNRFGDGVLASAVGIGWSWLTLLGILALGGYATGSFDLYDGRVLVAWAVATPLVQFMATRLGHAIDRWYAIRVAPRRRAIVVGAGPLGAKVAHALWARHGAGIELLGYFDDRKPDRLDPVAVGHLLGGLADVAGHVAEHGVREVYITLPLGQQPRIAELLKTLQETTASLYFVPDVFGITIIQGRLQDLRGVPVVGICDTPFTGTNELVKRISDVVLASFILVLISPLLLAIAIAVKASSPGPVIFRQRRNGLDGREIVVYKFRSMTTMDDGAVVRQATRNDQRITRVGAFLRRTSLDELPQFFNVLQGSMSIVGPRQHAVTHNQAYLRIIKAYMVRHKVKPGITGWAQVNGLRGETETVEKMQARIEYDLEYMRNWSLALDLRIIVATVRLVLFDRKAY